MATKRQKRLAKLVVENLRNTGKKRTVGGLAKEAGYAGSTSEHPKEHIVETRGFKEALADKLKEDDAADLQLGLMKMESLESFSFDIVLEDEKIKEVVRAMGCRILSIAVVAIIGKKVAYFAAPNGKIRAQGMDMYHKIQGNYAAQKIKVSDDIDDLPEEELDQCLAETEPMAARYLKYAREKRAREAKVKKKK